MNRNISTLLLFLVSFTFVFSQSKEIKRPDYNSIEKNIKNVKSQYYYPKLLQKLETNDTLFTPDQYHHLYYGYVFNEKYKSYDDYVGKETILKYLAKLDDSGEGLSKIEIADGLSILKRRLKDSPVDLYSIMHYIHFLIMNEEIEKGELAFINLIGILDAIMKSGNGLDCENSFHIIQPDDKYAVLHLMFEVKSVGKKLVGECEILELDQEIFLIPGLYFNMSKPFDKLIEFYGL